MTGLKMSSENTVLKLILPVAGHVICNPIGTGLYKVKQMQVHSSQTHTNVSHCILFSNQFLKYMEGNRIFANTLKRLIKSFFPICIKGITNPCFGGIFDQQVL